MVSAKKERQSDDQRTDQPTAQRVMVSGFEPRTFFPLHVQQQPRPEVRKIRRAPEFRRVSKLELTSPEPNSRPRFARSCRPPDVMKKLRSDPARSFVLPPRRDICFMGRNGRGNGP